MPTVTLLFFMIAAYCCGSLSSAILVCRALGFPDPRSEGSGNPGATNVLRIGGRKAALAVFLGDALKGWIPVCAAILAGLSPASASLVALAAFLGHLYPVFFRFQGGKGVATAFGCLLALSPVLGLALAGTWFATAILFRYSSLAALVTALLAPFFAHYFTGTGVIPVTGIMCALLVWRHRKNIHNLLTGRESKIGTGKKQ